MYKLLLAFYCLMLLAILLDADGSFLVNRSAPHDKKPKIYNYTLALRKYLDNEFYGSIRVGSRGQLVRVIFDTAWTTSWMLSKDCPPSMSGCKGHSLYDHDRSATYIRNGTRFIANEGAYNFSGYYSRDRINFGGASVTMDFVEMTNVPPKMADEIADGVIGLSPSSDGLITLPEMLYTQGMIKKPLFTIFLNRDFQSDKGGAILLGDINTKHIHNIDKEHKEEFTYVRVNDSVGKWAFRMDRVEMILEKKAIPFCSRDCDVYIDMGSIKIYAPKEAIDEINYRIHATDDGDEHAVDCLTIRKLPPINFVISGKNFTLKGPDYIRKVTIRNTVKCYSVFATGQTEFNSGWVLGASFLARYYSVYNFKTKVIGFVRAA